MNKKVMGMLIFVQLMIVTATFVKGGHTIMFIIVFSVTDIFIEIYLRSEYMQLKALSLAVLSSLAVNVDLRYQTEIGTEDYELGCFYSNRWLPLIMLCAFFFFYRYVIGETSEIRDSKRGRITVSWMAFLFSAFTIFGYSYQETDSWELIFANSYQMCKAYIFMIGFYWIAYFLLAWVYSSADKRTIRSLKLSRLFEWYMQQLKRHPFIAPFLTLIIVNIPYMITAYPAIFAGDTIDQLLQAFQIPYNSAKSTNLITQSQLINQHHSVIHTMIMHWMLCLGVKVFHSANIGLFIVTLGQTLLTFAGISYLVKTVVSEGFPDFGVILLMVYFAVSPRIQNMLFVLSKDVPYGAVTLISLVLLWKMITGRQCNKRTPYLYIVSLLALQMLRKEAIYIIVIQMIILIIVKRKQWITWGGGTAVIILVGLLLGKLIYPAYNISPSPVNEALSIPIQQTARYIRDYPDDVSPEERASIDKMWDYTALCENYDPRRSDIAKATFRKTSTGADWIEYFRAWLSMLRKHPLVYVQATLNNYFEYVYPGKELAEAHTFERREWDIDYANKMLGDKGVLIYYPQCMNSFRLFWETTRERVFRLPVLSLLLSVGFYTWVLLGCTAYWIYRKNTDAVLMFVPLLLILLVCLAGPCNGSYFRYFYPIVLCLPASMSLSWITGENAEG